MTKRLFSLHFCLAALISIAAAADATAQQEGDTLQKLKPDANRRMKPMFNGKDLTGWKPVNTAPSTWSVKDGMLVCTGKPIGELRTEKMYQNFIMEIEWRHLKPRGNAGIFVWADDITAKGVPFHRGIEVQVLENEYGNTKSYSTHGDIFPIHGATMTPINGRGGQRAFPIENRSKPSPQWNHYRITCIDGNISLAVNGKVVTRGKNCNPRKGYICIESEGGIVHYRNMKILELPGKDVPPEETAIADRGYISLYTGVDLDGWKTSSENWKSSDWLLKFTGKPEGDANTKNSLRTEQTFVDFGFLFDVRRQKDSGNAKVQIGGMQSPIELIEDSKLVGQHLSKPGRWDRFEGALIGDELTLTINGKTVCENKKVFARDKEPLAIIPDGPIEFANIFVRSVK